MKPATEWTDGEKRAALDALGAYDYVPLSPATIENADRFRSVEDRKLWIWTVEGSIAGIVNAWPTDGA
ncbi:hypothetical protein ACFO0N_19655 [Halobium salinum]|uniref:Uncharacterized protein n=1 Tax=Halobium salinum TaxID=1364940 RepID=A0ABD5PI93_9EURY